MNTKFYVLSGNKRLKRLIISKKMNNKQGEIQSNNYQQCSFFKYMSKFMVKGTMYRRTKRLHKNIGSTYDSISLYIVIHFNGGGGICKKK